MNKIDNKLNIVIN